MSTFRELKSVFKRSASISLLSTIGSLINYLGISYLYILSSKQQSDIYFKWIAIPCAISGLIIGALWYLMPIIRTLKRINSSAILYLILTIYILALGIFLYGHNYNILILSIIQNIIIVLFNYNLIFENSQIKAAILNATYSVLVNLAFIFLKNTEHIYLWAIFLQITLLEILVAAQLYFKKENYNTENSNQIKFDLKIVIMTILAISGNTMWPVVDFINSDRMILGELGELSISQRFQIAISGLISTGLYNYLGVSYTGGNKEKFIFYNRIIKLVFAFSVVICILVNSSLLFAMQLEINFNIYGVLNKLIVIMISLPFVNISIILLRYYSSENNLIEGAYIGLMFLIAYALLAYFLSFELHGVGVALAFVISWALAGIFSYVRFRKINEI